MNKVLRRPDVCGLTGLSYSTIYRLERRGDFPRRRRLGPNAVGWLAAEVNRWIEARAVAAPAGTPTKTDSPTR